MTAEPLPSNSGYNLHGVFVRCVVLLMLELDCDVLRRIPGQACEELLAVPVSNSGGLGVYPAELDGDPCLNHCSRAAHTLFYKMVSDRHNF